jgi:ankyrin repeat protein
VQHTGASDVTGSTCLHRVAFLGQCQVGRLLLKGGCPIDAVNLEGDAAIHIAAREVQ